MSFKLKVERIKTLYKLGLFNLYKVALYRLKCRMGWYTWFYAVKSEVINLDQSFWQRSENLSSPMKSDDPLVSHVDKYLQGKWQYYFFHWFDHGQALPKWSWNPFINREWQQNNAHWSQLAYFSTPGDDIKHIWELSRFYWAPQFAYAYKITGQQSYLDRLNLLITDWCQQNKPNAGYQWLCAQETSVRLLNVLLADQIIGNQHNLSDNLAIFVQQHLQRILPTLAYARAQDNNHATTEAAALFIGGLWLQRCAINHNQRKLASRSIKKGQHNIECLVRRLILADGTFSQYSVTYHRMLLDTLSLLVCFQNKLSGPKLSESFYQQYRLAFEWLYAMMMSNEGFMPNLGSNDGALLFKLDCCDYRDFRPSLQLASFLLDRKLLFNAEGEYNQSLHVLGLFSGDKSQENYIQYQIASKDYYPDGGFRFLTHEKFKILIRFPVFKKFRPCQCDSLHVDCWMGDKNILLDSGTFSYNPANPKQNLKWTENHNTVQYGQYQQMPSLSRFLWGGWPQSKVLLNTDTSFVAAVQYFSGYGHSRQIELGTLDFTVTDEIRVDKIENEPIICYWHLLGNDWKIEGNRIVSQQLNIEISVVAEHVQFESIIFSLHKADHALYYSAIEQHTCLQVRLPVQKSINVFTYFKLQG